MIKRLTFALLTVTLISGCTAPVTERVGAQLDVVPVTYSISIKIKNGEQDKAAAKLTEFTNKHWQEVASRGVNISWQTSAGKILAQQYYTQLAARGVNVSDLTLTQINVSQQSVDKDDLAVNKKYFDIEVKTTTHKVISEVCQYPQIGHYGELADGCSSESNRWKSMVHPEKMLNNTL